MDPNTILLKRVLKELVSIEREVRGIRKRMDNMLKAG